MASSQCTNFYSLLLTSFLLCASVKAGNYGRSWPRLTPAYSDPTIVVYDYGAVIAVSDVDGAKPLPDKPNKAVWIRAKVSLKPRPVEVEGENGWKRKDYTEVEIKELEVVAAPANSSLLAQLGPFIPFLPLWSDAPKVEIGANFTKQLSVPFRILHNNGRLISIYFHKQDTGEESRPFKLGIAKMLDIGPNDATIKANQLVNEAELPKIFEEASPCPRTTFEFGDPSSDVMSLRKLVDSDGDCHKKNMPYHISEGQEVWWGHRGIKANLILRAAAWQHLELPITLNSQQKIAVDIRSELSYESTKGELFADEDVPIDRTEFNHLWSKGEEQMKAPSTFGRESVTELLLFSKLLAPALSETVSSQDLFSKTSMHLDRLLSFGEEWALSEFHQRMLAAPLRAATSLHRLVDVEFRQSGQLEWLRKMCETAEGAARVESRNGSRALHHSCMLVWGAKVRQLCVAKAPPTQELKAACAREVKRLLHSAYKLIHKGSGDEEAALAGVRALGNLGSLASFDTLRAMWVNESLSIRLRVESVDAGRLIQPSTLQSEHLLNTLLADKTQPRELRMAALLSISQSGPNAAMQQRMIQIQEHEMNRTNEAESRHEHCDREHHKHSETAKALRSLHDNSTRFGFTKHFNLMFGSREIIPGGFAAGLEVVDEGIFGFVTTKSLQHVDLFTQVLQSATPPELTSTTRRDCGLSSQTLKRLADENGKWKMLNLLLVLNSFVLTTLHGNPSDVAKPGGSEYQRGRHDGVDYLFPIVVKVKQNSTSLPTKIIPPPPMEDFFYWQGPGSRSIIHPTILGIPLQLSQRTIVGALFKQSNGTAGDNANVPDFLWKPFGNTSAERLEMRPRIATILHSGVVVGWPSIFTLLHSVDTGGRFNPPHKQREGVPPVLISYFAQPVHALQLGGEQGDIASALDEQLRTGGTSEGAAEVKEATWADELSQLAIKVESDWNPLSKDSPRVIGPSWLNLRVMLKGDTASQHFDADVYFLALVTFYQQAESDEICNVAKPIGMVLLQAGPRTCAKCQSDVVKIAMHLDSAKALIIDILRDCDAAAQARCNVVNIDMVEPAFEMIKGLSDEETLCRITSPICRTEANKDMYVFRENHPSCQLCKIAHGKAKMISQFVVKSGNAINSLWCTNDRCLGDLNKFKGAAVTLTDSFLDAERDCKLWLTCWDPPKLPASCMQRGDAGNVIRRCLSVNCKQGGDMLGTSCLLTTPDTNLLYIHNNCKTVTNPNQWTACAELWCSPLGLGFQCATDMYQMQCNENQVAIRCLEIRCGADTCTNAVALKTFTGTWCETLRVGWINCQSTIKCYVGTDENGVQWVHNCDP